MFATGSATLDPNIIFPVLEIPFVDKIYYPFSFIGGSLQRHLLGGWSVPTRMPDHLRYGGDSQVKGSTPPK